MELNNKIMFPQSGLLLNDVIEMVVAFNVAFGLTSEGRSYLIEMLKICAGSEFEYLQLSDYALNKHFNPSDKIKYYFYCNNCKKEVIHSSTKEGIKKQKKKALIVKQKAPLVLVATHIFYLLILSTRWKYCCMIKKCVIV